MFDSNEHTSFKRALFSAVRVFILLIALFISGEMLLGGSLSRFFSGIELESVEDGLTSSVAEASGVLASIESSVRLLGETQKRETSEGTLDPVPWVGSSAYIVANIDSGEIYAEKNADEPMAIASISKLITALVASGSVAANPTLTVGTNAVNVGGNTANLSAGETMGLEDMMYPLLLNSANDASLSIADHYGRDFFKTLMNKQAKEIGMTQSSFVEPSGLSSENISTARDLFKLAQYIDRNKQFIFDITKIDEKTVESTLSSGRAREVRYRNIHQLRDIEGFMGGKNGFTTAAGKTLLTLFNIEDRNGNEQTVAIIVLDSVDSTRDSLTLLSWLKNSQ